MSYKLLNEIFFYNQSGSVKYLVRYTMQFLDIDPYKKKYNLNIKQMKFNNVMYELYVYFYIKKIYSIYLIRSNIKLILKETNKLRHFKNLKRKK